VSGMVATAMATIDQVKEKKPSHGSKSADEPKIHYQT